MSRFVQFALFAFLALATFVAVVRAEDKFFDDDGKEMVFFDSEVGDNEFEDDQQEKRSLNIRGKSSFGMDHGPSCGDFIRLCNPKVSRCVRVRIVDECAGCKQNHIDLTKSAFKRLATTGTLDEGVTTGLTMWYSSKPNPWDLSLFGPFKLQ